LLIPAPNLLSKFWASTSRSEKAPRMLWSSRQFSRKETNASTSDSPKKPRKLPRRILFFLESFKGTLGTEGCFTFLLAVLLAMGEFQFGQKYKLGPSNIKKRKNLYRFNALQMLKILRE